MTINDKIKKEVVKLLAKHEIKIKADELAVPPSQEMGDLALPCFNLAKKYNKTAPEAAQYIVDNIKPHGLIINIKNIGPYVNFLFDFNKIAELVIKEINRKKNNYGKIHLGKGQKIMIEYSQPNTHKEFHIGHLRNVCLGISLINIYKNCGYKVIAANYIGDSGAHVAKTLWYYKNFLTKTDFPAEPKERGEFLGQIYARASAKVEEKLDYKNEVQDVLQKLENNDPYYTKLWQQTKKWSMDQFKQIYQELGAKFNVYFYESVEEKEGKKMLPQLLKQEFIRESEGAIIADLQKYDLGILVLVREDGTSLYGIKDIPLGIKKFKKYKLAKSIYIVDNRQSQYLQQIFKILELIGHKNEMVHVPYEFVKLKSGIMASRTGNVVTYNEVKQVALQKVMAETKQRHADWSAKKIEETSLAIVMAALKFGMLKSNNNKIITFDIEESLDINGFTGPYLQYSYARINSIFKKLKTPFVATKIDYQALATDIEKQLIKDLIHYPDVLQEALQINDPSVIIQYVYKLAQDLNTFYHELPVLKADKDIKLARLTLLKAVKQVLHNSMAILGIPIISEM